TTETYTLSLHDALPIFEGDPRVAGLEQHGQHAPPQLDRADLAEHLDLAGLGGPLVGLVPLGERLAVQVVQVRHLVRGEQRPLARSEEHTSELQSRENLV